jgi:hypothetical protein
VPGTARSPGRVIGDRTVTWCGTPKPTLPPPSHSYRNKSKRRSPFLPSEGQCVDPDTCRR